MSHPEVLKHLNVILRNELVAINQYFLHAKIFEDRGYKKLADITKAESIEEMKHADSVIARILFLKGAPNMIDYKGLKIGDDIITMFKGDRQLEIEALADLKAAIAVCIKAQDIGSKDLLEKILLSEEKHLDFLETQLEIIKSITIENYLAMQL